MEQEQPCFQITLTQSQLDRLKEAVDYHWDNGFSLRWKEYFDLLDLLSNPNQIPELGSASH